MMESGDIAILAMIAGVVAAVWIRRFIDHRKRMNVSRKAIRGEKKAVDLLEKNGYRILEKQLSGKVLYYINEEPKESLVRADLLVKKNGRSYIVEIKTGDQANPKLPAVRRQMMEYDRVFSPHGILFIDMEKNRIQSVRFDHKGMRFQAHLTDFLFGLVAGVLIAVSVYAVMS